MQTSKRRLNQAQPPLQSFDGAVSTINVAYQSRLLSNYKLMIEHPVFNDVMSKDGVSDTQAIFTSEAYLKGMANAGYYLCAGNVLWGKVVVDDTAPASKTKTDNWMNTYYGKAEGEFPSHMGSVLLIDVCTTIFDI